MVPGPEALDTVTIDPFADLLFALIAAVLPMILLLVATAHPPPPKPAEASRPPVEDAATVAVVVGRNGLRWAAHALVPPDAIPDDADLRGLLRDAAAAGTQVTEVIEPDGLESAFLFEPVAAAAGGGAVRQLRAVSPCATTGDPTLRRLCGTIDAGAP